MENISYEIPEQFRPEPPQGGSGVKDVINAPVSVYFGEELITILKVLNRIKDTTERILDNLDKFNDKCGNFHIDFRMEVDSELDSEKLKKLLMDAVHNGDIKFSFSPNQRKETS